MIPSRETLLDLHDRYRFAAGGIEIILRLRDVLEAIGKDSFLSKSLVLKGGTALNLCFGPPPRMSVDLDFNYIGSVDLGRMTEDRPETISRLERIARRAGYQVQFSRAEHAGQKLYLRYRSALGGEGTLQMDVNFLYRLPLDSIQELPFWDPVGGTTVKTRVVATAELIAGKMIALLDRVAPRDLYDVAYLEKRRRKLKLGRKARALFIALSGILSRPLTEYSIERLERVTDDAVRDTLHPLLREDDRPDANELRRSAAKFAGAWLKLSASEREYVGLIQKGELRPELLFPKDSAMVDKLSRHPALLWKAKNAKSAASRVLRRASEEE